MKGEEAVPGGVGRRSDGNAEARVERFLAGPAGGRLEALRVERLVGDASTRTYFRLHLPGGERAVLALLPAPFEERELPYLRMAGLFRELGLRVPEVREACGPQGVLVLEDLGNVLLQDAVRDASDEDRRGLYSRSVDLIVRLQREAASRLASDPDRVPVSFDEGKLADELLFFRDHFLCGLRGASLGGFERDSLERHFRTLARELSRHPFVLCHRDFHSRNLMLVEEELVVIDFQDARFGPRCYDLASLLADSYVELSPELVEKMKERFSRAVDADLSAEYDVVALQRNLKALGTFGFQIARRGNEVYHPYVPHTLGLVRANLERNRRFDDLRRILARHLEELG